MTNNTNSPPSPAMNAASPTDAKRESVAFDPEFNRLWEAALGDGDALVTVNALIGYIDNRIAAPVSQGSATSGEAVATWQERMGPGYIDGGADLPEEAAMKAEIADLRAALAASAEQSSPDHDGKFAQGMLAQLARMGASPAGLSLAVQLFGVGPCAACGFRKLHCRCPASAEQSNSAVLADALADPDKVPYLIVFDDTDRDNELIIGGTRARYRFKQISGSWNAHLFAKVASNSRDDPHYSANFATPVAEQSNTPVPRVGDNWMERAHKFFLEGMREIGLGDGSAGWIEHDVNGKLVRDGLSLEGEIHFGFEQIKALIDGLRATPVAERAASIEIDGRTYTAAELKGRIQQLDAEAEAVSQQHAAGAKRIEELEALLAERAAAPASVPEGFALVPIVPTREMIEAACALDTEGEDGMLNAYKSLYDTMISAAPEVAQPAAQGESIDTPQFCLMVEEYRHHEGAAKVGAYRAIVAHVHAWGKSLATPAPTAGEASAEAKAVIDAAWKLVKAKGRFHTEQNYKALDDAVSAHIKATQGTRDA